MTQELLSFRTKYTFLAVVLSLNQKTHVKFMIPKLAHGLKLQK